MKKTLLILLAALICLSGVSCGENEAPETTGQKTEAASASSTSEITGSTAPATTTEGVITTLPAPNPDDPTPQPDAEDTLLYSQDGISVYFRSVTRASLGKEITFFVSNSGDSTVTVETRIMAINRYAIPSTKEIELISMSAGILQHTAWNTDLKTAGITDITEITLKITARKGSKTLFTSEQTVVDPG